ncbi:hypothetical protein ACRAWD_26005 [Caulobacter segnis]
MSTAIAIGTWRRPSRRDLRRNLAILALALLAHGLVLLALVSGARWAPQMAEPPIIEAELLDASLALADTPQAAPPEPVHVRPSVKPHLAAAPEHSRRAARQALRSASHCRAAGVHRPQAGRAERRHPRQPPRKPRLPATRRSPAWNRDQKAACAEADGQRSRTAPMYAAIDPDKKAFFDGDCAKDDEWCLYRIGKGPYPGIFALGKKKKHKGWDD